MDDRESFHAAALHHLPSASEAKLDRIAKSGASFEALWNAKESGAFVRLGMKEEDARKLVDEIGRFDVAVLSHKLAKESVRVVTLRDGLYPLLLKEIAAPPPVLYVRGNVENLKNVCLAVVGTRAISRYGRSVIALIVPELVRAGITIVSGLAMGVDADAHAATVKAGGKTIAVLGSGVDRITPRQNAALGEKILISGGTLVSEFPLGTEPTAYTFPIRNRVISGLSRGVLVIEAKERSGSLITAKCALEQNRDAFAVPGDISRDNSGGTNALIRSGEAKLVGTAEDVLSELGLEGASITIAETLQEMTFDSEQEERLYRLLDKEGKETDALIRESCLAAHEATGILTLLEMKRMAKNLGGGVWVRN